MVDQSDRSHRGQETVHFWWIKCTALILGIDLNVFPEKFGYVRLGILIVIIYIYKKYIYK